MATSTQIDHGDYVETITGEPTWDNPADWHTSTIAWKQGTPGYAQQQASSALATFTGQLAGYVTQSQADANAWPTADQATRDQIMGRVLGGFANLCTALQDLATHLNLSG